MISFTTFLLATVHPMNTGSIASNNASYDGSMLVLDGEVSLEHGLGEMRAEKAVLTRPLEEKEEFPFACIELAEAVSLALKTTAHVECERALLDFSTMQGTLTSPNKVHYTDTINLVPIELFSSQLDLQMVKNKESYDIERAHAQKGVHFIYNKWYHLRTEAIVLAGDILHSDGNSCSWSCQDGHMDADSFDLNLTQNALHLKAAKGCLKSLFKEELRFTAEELDWKHTENHLVLKGSPSIQGTTIGTLQADTAQIYYQEDQQGLHPDRLELQGHIKILSQDTRGIADTLTYNPDSRLCILKALQGQKVLFMRDQDGLRISASEVHITYNPETKQQEVQGIGHVTMLFSPEEQNLITQVFGHAFTTP